MADSGENKKKQRKRRGGKGKNIQEQTVQSTPELHNREDPVDTESVEPVPSFQIKQATGENIKTAIGRSVGEYSDADSSGVIHTSRESSTTDPCQEFSTLSLSTGDGLLPPQKRLNGQFPGRAGKPCSLTTNHFPIKLRSGLIYMYNVTIVSPWNRPFRRSDKPIYHQVLQAWRQVCPPIKNCPQAWVYDGVKTLYSTKRVDGVQDCSVTIIPRGDERKYEFKVTEVEIVKTIPVNDDIAKWAAKGRSGSVPQDAIHALDVILSQAVTTDLQFEVIGRSHFPTKGNVLDIGFGKEVWTGLFSSVRPMGWKDVGLLATLNVDISNKPATKELHMTRGQNSYLMQVLEPGRGVRHQKVDYRSGLTREQVFTLEKDIKGLKVRYELPSGSKRSYKVNGVKDAANKLVITDLNITVEKYFDDTYKKKLEFPNLPCLWLGSITKSIYIPLEMCSMQSQALPRGKALQDDAVAKMIRGTALPPFERQKRILEGLKKNNKAFATDPYAKEFGINISGEMASLKGRILQPPGIEYNQRKVVDINSNNPGKWQQRGEHRYVDGRALENWGVLDLARLGDKEWTGFVDSLTKVGSGLGLKVNNGDDNLCAKVTNEDTLERDFIEMVQKKSGIQMILVILPFKLGNVYDKVKQLGDIEHNIPTQCCLKRNLFKPDGSVNIQVIANICLKLNSKLGGINHVLAQKSRPKVLQTPVMIMGADVTHPAPEHKGIKPSIAAIVASCDPKASKYEVQIRVQDSSQNEEVIHDMKEVTKILLRRFKQETNFKPSRLIMFRDGVSEGQFLTVLARELTAIRSACQELEPNGSYEPEITYLVVQKRHHTRFFPSDNNCYKNGNPLAGTVIDQGINHPTEGDFYLLSHEGIQGTSRPCHYQVLWDDANMTADDLEILSYYLCHLYSRCTRSVSYPTPTYYSHLAAERARKHHNELTNQGKKLSSTKIKEIIEQTRANMMYFV